MYPFILKAYRYFNKSTFIAVEPYFSSSILSNNDSSKGIPKKLANRNKQNDKLYRISLDKKLFDLTKPYCELKNNFAIIENIKPDSIASKNINKHRLNNIF